MSPEPFTIGALAVSALMAVMQGVSSYQANKQNAAAAKAEGKQAEAAGLANAARQRQIIAAQQSQLTADVGASGTLMSGSPMEVYLANAREGEITAQDEIYKGRLTALGKYNQARIYKQQGTSALIGGIGGAASTLGSAKLK